MDILASTGDDWRLWRGWGMGLIECWGSTVRLSEGGCPDLLGQLLNSFSTIEII